jgi:DNA-binding NarL/FixJ family response regulator
VVILDLTMPRMSGMEAAARIGKLGGPSAVLIFTMHESERLLAEIRETGARGFVHKSRAGRDLILAIESLLSGGTFFGGPINSTAPSKATEPDPGAANRRIGFGIA